MTSEKMLPHEKNRKLVQEHYDALGRAYDKEQRVFYKNRVNSSRALLRKAWGEVVGKRVLDAGCGSGKDLETLLQLGADAYGIDISRVMLNIARERGIPPSRLSQQDAVQTSFRDETFDLVTSRYALHYVTDLERLFGELNRILKPGGRVTAVVAHPLLPLLSNGRPINYFEQKLTEVSIFGGNCVLFEPTHSFSEWLRAAKYFSILDIDEHDRNENLEAEGHLPTEDKVPDYLFLHLRKG